MKTLYKIKKGLDLKLKGEATAKLSAAALSSEYAVMPADFPGIVPRTVVKEGDNVLAGQTLFVDKLQNVSSSYHLLVVQWWALSVVSVANCCVSVLKPMKHKSLRTLE